MLAILIEYLHLRGVTVSDFFLFLGQSERSTFAVLLRPREKMRLASAHWLASRERGLRLKPLRHEYTAFCKKHLSTPRYMSVDMSLTL